MPHVAFVPFTGFRIREAEMLELGMTLPGLRQRAHAISQLPALGLLTLAGMLPRDWTCSYHDAENFNEALVETVTAERPTLVAISALTASKLEAYCFSDRLRARGVQTVLGGLHATACPNEAIAHCDAVVVGDGESVWPQILSDAENDSLRPLYRSNKPFDLSDSPTPQFELLGQRFRPRLTIQTQRGCPLACEFCGASRLLGPYRVKPVANIQRELSAIRKLETQPVLELADDNTFVGDRDPMPLLDALSEAGCPYFTEVDWRIGDKPDLLSKLSSSGCVQVLVGIESLVFRHSGMGPKLADLSRIMDAVSAIQEAGVAVIGCFIVGCDGENRHSLDRLVEFIHECPLADIQLTLQTPFPGTALYRHLQRQNRLISGRDWSHYTLFDVTYQPSPMSVDELTTAFHDTVRSVFNPTASARRSAIRREIWRKNLRP